jgi:lipopolysaccharide biosynthesis regulator YciM
MLFELWWLIALPVFFALGWIASRFEARHLLRASARLPDAYFTGLNFLLNEQPDKAIDAFVDVVKLDPETVALHFALGNLFRRRGENDRAIRVHQSLLARSDLQAGQREHALFELGHDFLRAGLLDRAEDALVRLEGGAYAGPAVRLRLEIAQMVRDWPRAIELAQRVGRDSGLDPQALIAHFHCEMAQQAMIDVSLSAGERQRRVAEALDLALKTGGPKPRPALLRGDAAFEAGDYEAAIQAWGELERISPAHLALTGEKWLAAHEALGALDTGLQRLEAALQGDVSVDALRALAHGRVRRDGPAAAVTWMRDVLAKKPSLLGLEQLLELQRNAPGAVEPSSESVLTAALIKRQAKRLARFECRHCGFKAQRFYWQCPGCNRWDTTAPQRIEELET